MDEAAPITWLIDQINQIVNSGVSGVATAISNGVAPIASACFGIYVILIMWGYMRGTTTDPIQDFMLRMASWAVIIGLGLNASNYIATVVPMVTGLGGDLANMVSGGNVSSSTLDTLALQYLNIIQTGYDKANSISGLEGIAAVVMYSVKALIIIFGLAPFLIAATSAIVVANVGSAIIAMIGPFFFACLLFPPTRQYFSAWLNSALSYAFIPFIIAIVANVSVGISQRIIGNDLFDATFTTVFLAAIGNLLLLFLLKYVSALASSLSAGGINIGSIGGVGSFASSAKNSASGSMRDARQMRIAGRRMGQAYAGAKTNVANRFNSIRKAG